MSGRPVRSGSPARTGDIGATPAEVPAWIAFAGALGAGTAVALGAFGAHALADLVTTERLATFETGVRYQFLHALALLLLHHGARAGAVAAAAARRIAWTVVVGVALFSGSLFALVFSGWGAFGAIAPVGGVLLLAGWGQWAWAVRPRRG